MQLIWCWMLRIFLICLDWLHWCIRCAVYVYCNGGVYLAARSWRIDCRWIYWGVYHRYQEKIFNISNYLGITIIVVAIPEGLPLAVTIALAYSTSKMYADQCFIRYYNPLLLLLLCYWILECFLHVRQWAMLLSYALIRREPWRRTQWLW